ncbi:MAG: MASE1 domain-containing protein [Caulobacterales bacterium]
MTASERPTTATARDGYRRGVVKFAQAVMLGVTAFALAWVSLTITRQDGRVAAIWPMNAVVLVCLLRTDARRWPGLMIAALAGNLAADAGTGDALFSGVALSLANSLEVGLCAAGLRGVAGRRLDLSQSRHIWLFAGLCGLAGPLISAMAAAAVLGPTGEENPVRALVTWALTDSLGLLLLVPPLLLMRPSNLAQAATSPKLAANGLALSGLAMIVAWVFLQTQLPLLFLIPPALLFATFQMEAAGAALGLLITAVIAVALTATGLGPTALLTHNLAHQMFYTQVFLFVTAVTTLPVGAILSQRRRDEISLATSEARYRLLAENCTDLVILMGPDGAIDYVSPSVHQFGYQPAELIGRKTTEFVHPDDRERAIKIVQDLFTGDPPDPGVRREYRVATKAGDYVWLEGNSTILRNELGRPRQVVTNYRDVTARRRLEDELVVARAQVEAKLELLAKSHEARTPLTGEPLAEQGLAAPMKMTG